jgi:hypothetical protein
MRREEDAIFNLRTVVIRSPCWESRRSDASPTTPPASDPDAVFSRNFPRVCDDDEEEDASGADEDDGGGAGTERNLPRRGAAAGAGSAGDDAMVRTLFLIPLRRERASIGRNL